MDEKNRGGSLSRQYNSMRFGPDRENSIVISDSESSMAAAETANSDKEPLSSGRNSVDANFLERGSSQEQLENSIQRAIKRTIKRFSNSSVNENQVAKTEKSPKNSEADDVSDHDEVFVNEYRRRSNVMQDSLDEELDVGKNTRKGSHKFEDSNKTSNDESDHDDVFINGYRRKYNVIYSQNFSDIELETVGKKSRHASLEIEDKSTPEESSTPLYRRLQRKRRVICKSDSSDDEIPLKKTKSELSQRSLSPEYKLPERAMTPEYGLPANKSDESDIKKEPIIKEDPVQYISEAGGSKDKSLKLPRPDVHDVSTDDEKFLHKTGETAGTDVKSSDDDFDKYKRNAYGNLSNSSNSQSEMSDSDINVADNDYHCGCCVFSEEPSSSDDDCDVEDYMFDDYDQRRAILIDKKRQIERRLAVTNMQLKTENFGKADRLRLTKESAQRKLSNILTELENLVVERKWDQLSYGPSKKSLAKKSSLFKDNTFEMDPAYLVPKLGGYDKKLGKQAQATLNREQSLTVERLKDLHGSLLDRPVEHQKATDPRGLKVPLMPHQQHALAWLQWREQQKPRGGVLADEMGLGKTLTMIALVLASIAKDNDGEGSENEEEWKTSARGQQHLGGTLVVVPASLLSQWEAEVKNRCKRDTIKVEVYHGAKRETLPKRLAKNDIVITTYNIVCREYKMWSLLFKIRWRRVILDEAHVIRNHKSQPCQSVCALHTSKRWAVTGTPLHNKEMDLYSLLKFLQCSPFDDVRVWKRWVDNRNDAGHERLATVMKTLMLRRTKEELQQKGELPPLPDKTVQVIEVTLDPEERLVYDKVMLYSRTLFAQFLTQRAEKARNFEFGGGNNIILEWNYRDTTFTKAQNKLLSLHADVQAHEILVLLIRLRQVCCHPSLIKAMLDRNDIELQAGTDNEMFAKINKMHIDDNENDNDEDSNDFGLDERVAEHLLTAENPVFEPDRQSSKIRAVISKIEEVLDRGDKIIVVSQWVGVLNIIAKELDTKDDASYRMFTGQVAVKDRQAILDDFNSQQSEPNILLLSLTAGGVGLNVVGANHMLLVDIHWNPQLESQAQDRIHRFGQKKEVSVYKYICTDTIEERIQALQNKKLELARQVLSGTGKVIGSKLSLDDIKSLFGI